ncbi:hypothetical protein MtrunA17_Chr2g0333561 [Medicago truncatula]|uniref:Transmembrane protein n=1 Tax=Medicago truncatula TaxID=3880 RepID=A0A396JEB2_MEDTR|nr:hypothetical protein MtrunA17_Chr2g0333561 [Medicago truncatula]
MILRRHVLNLLEVMFHIETLYGLNAAMISILFGFMLKFSYFLIC